MTAITIRNHQKLKMDLEKALAEYSDLSKKRFQFFVGPGDKGLARADYILDELKAIGDLNSPNEQKKLEILFAAIIASDVYTSTVGRLRNLILDCVVGKSEELSFNEGANENQLKTTLRDKHNLYITRLREHPTFDGLTSLSSYSAIDFSKVLEISEKHYVCTLSFSRTEALKVVADGMKKKYAQEQKLNETIAKINRVLEIKETENMRGTFELKPL